MQYGQATVHRPAARVMVTSHRPRPDMHLPLAGANAGPWRVATWTIRPEDGGLADEFVVFLAEGEATAVPDTIDLPTSFGPRRLALAPATEPLGADAAAAIASTILKCIGRADAEAVEPLLAAVAALGALPSPSATGRLDAEGRRLTVDGIHAASRVASFAGPAPLVARTTRLGYDGREPTGTTFDLDRPLPRDDVVLLGLDEATVVATGGAT